MAHLWIRDTEEGWTVFKLSDIPASLSSFPPRMLDGIKDGHSSVVLQSAASAELAGWALISSPSSEVRINGHLSRLGLHVLAERDEIRVEDLPRMIFSAERLASIQPFPGAERAGCCPRCKQEINVLTLAVQCPGCGVWHHQTEDLPCWTYAEKCAACSRVTDLNAGFSWTPDEV